MHSAIRRLAATAGLGTGMVLALTAAPAAGADPGPTCLTGAAQVSYCDTDVSADGSWVRCSRPAAADVYVFGGVAGRAPLGAGSCERVTAAALPAGSPPYHIGYGGEAFGRV